MALRQYSGSAVGVFASNYFGVCQDEFVGVVVTFC